VDDLKVSSRSSKQIQQFITELKEIYKEITVHEGSSHDYLGMVMTNDKASQSVMVDMRDILVSVFKISKRRNLQRH
jgi:hypothetical protein